MSPEPMSGSKAQQLYQVALAPTATHRHDLSGNAYAARPDANVFFAGDAASPFEGSPNTVDSMDSPDLAHKNWVPMPRDELGATLRRQPRAQMELRQRQQHGSIPVSKVVGHTNYSAPDAAGTLQSLPYPAKAQSDLKPIPFTPTARSGSQFVPLRATNDPDIKAKISAVIELYPELHGQFKRRHEKKAYNSRPDPFERYSVLGETVTLMKKGSAVLVRDGNAWAETLKYFKRFGKRHGLVRVRVKPPAPAHTHDVEDSAANLAAAVATNTSIGAAINESYALAGARGGGALEYTLARPRQRKTGSTPRLKMTPSMVQVKLDDEIDGAIQDAKEACLRNQLAAKEGEPHDTWRLHVDEDYKPEVTSISRFRTRMINGEVVLFSWRQGRLQVQDGSQWVNLASFLASQRGRLVRRDTLDRAWSTRPKSFKATHQGMLSSIGALGQPHPRVATPGSAAQSCSVARNRPGPSTGRPASAAKASAGHGNPRLAYEVSALKQTHQEKLRAQQVPWRFRGLQLSVDVELNELQETQDKLQTRQQALLDSMARDAQIMDELLSKQHA